MLRHLHVSCIWLCVYVHTWAGVWCMLTFPPLRGSQIRQCDYSLTNVISSLRVLPLGPMYLPSLPAPPPPFTLPFTQPIPAKSNLWFLIICPFCHFSQRDSSVMSESVMTTNSSNLLWECRTAQRRSWVVGRFCNSDLFTYLWAEANWKISCIAE